ncbi:integral membrane protein [Pseudozyma hubeiensis SY62]|uniref:Integral membrane protein n=1 Tax=Pseudozyma hubeiensis (strain SY62) TaxID=1305764 RepID=R9NW76_PSEHS|nr:integral membrane protein [Pseudozyma hubeiensis SY62]GAC92808.1 integral membrane protein [Pseudozyma hubeiensis SY62]
MTRSRSIPLSGSRAPALFAVLVLATLYTASFVSSASIQAATGGHVQPPDSLLVRSQASVHTSFDSILPRHGDHEDEAAAEGDDHQQSMDHDMPMSVQHAEPASDGLKHGGHHGHDHGHAHAHQDVSADGPSPASIPDATLAGSELRDLPVWHTHKGHSHSHSGPVLEQLNETLLFRAHGPDPLSYIEWDSAYGLGSAAQLRRFVSNADILAGKPMMGVVDDRWRKLLDEQDAGQRQEIAADIASRLPDADDEGPSRYRGLLILHVVTAVVSCFVLLPMALVLRAAHSTLAPFISLLYLALLAGSMLVSVAYKALTPRLYPDNAHGSMGWAILWISLITLGSDVFRLAGQIWSIITAMGSQKRSKGTLWLEADGGASMRVSRSWRDVVATMLGRNQHQSRSVESYDALEEEAMLSEEAQSHAQELDIEKHMQHRFSSRRSPSSSRSHSGSGSPHRVHFQDNVHSEPVQWVGSGSTAVSSAGGQPRHAHFSEDGNVMVASPTTTACNTPRNSIFGGDSTSRPPLSLTTISLWNKQTHSDHTSWSQDGPADAAAVPASGNKSRSCRLSTFRTVMRYTRVVAARSLPVLAFATSYAGLAVYTGSCRGGYKNVCLAHGIKGGIFFWFGLLTFARYLGAYADCGWAWNKRPSGQAARNSSGGRATWRRRMPSAEFVECLVIFIYGASNTWMERFGAAPDDPYTIKQIQHISIAVMFWFAGLMGMLLETKWIRDMLSFPIVHNHVAAVSLREARRRHRRIANAHQDGVDVDLELMVEAQTQPASYSASFNPFPALVIGVTGVAMAAHHQDYQYEVDIHSLWGLLLAGFALLRCLTYFLLWLRPPTASVLPSRPPTEALAAFSLCCGGLVFMLSSEEVSFAAMRSGYGDFMAILNVAVAVVALLFCWTTTLMMLKGWAVRVEVRRTLVQQEEEQMSDRVPNALGLEATTAGGEREPRHMRAKVVSEHVDPVGEAEPVFVLEDDEDGTDDKDDQHQQSTSRVSSHVI